MYSCPADTEGGYRLIFILPFGQAMRFLVPFTIPVEAGMPSFLG